MVLSGSNITVRNNVIMNARVGIGSYDSLSSAIEFSDNNIWHNINSGNTNGMFSGNDGADWFSWSQWQAMGHDKQSILDDPNLSPVYHLQLGSPAIDSGSDLSSLGIPDLDLDKDGTARPQGTAWDIGAYEYVNGTACAHKSDIPPCDGCVSNTELISFIDRWKFNNQDVTIRELIEAIWYWKRGC